ncbi:MAG: 3-methyl-2-oxobutanoate hydroxymethyltransferase [Candidatus Omnitrophota bacterium]
MRISPQTIRLKKKKEKITVLTAYDFPTGRILDEAGLDILLVGDTLGMVILGYESTVPVTMAEMIHHTKAVSRAVRRALLVADMPYGSYASPELAVRNAKRFIEECGASAIKLEGGTRVAASVKAILKSGIPVMGHIGMTPQTADELGGYKVQGRTRAGAEAILRDAKCLDKLGVFAIVLECIPAALAQRITRAVSCPTIGIGAGPHTDGQVLVTPDLLGFESKVHPRFVRRYAFVEKMIRKAAAAYRNDVLRGRFPSAAESY